MPASSTEPGVRAPSISSSRARRGRGVVVLRTVTDLYRSHRQSKLGVRLLGVALSNLVGSEDSRQLLLPFDCVSRVGSVIDQVRTKYGYDSVHFGDAGAATGSRRGDDIA